MDHHLGAMAILFLRQDHVRGEGIVVEDAFELGEPLGNELAERIGDLDVTASDIDAHNGKVSSLQFPVSSSLPWKLASW